MNRLSPEKRAQVIAALVEGNSIRSTCRMTRASKNTVTKLLLDMGTVCSVYMDERFRDLPCERMQCDEIWAFCGMKQRNVPLTREMEDGLGDVWTWVAIDPDTKLVPTYRVGGHELNDAKDFMLDLSSRLRHRIQLTTDAYRAYPQAVREAFHGEIDYAVLQKLYGEDHSQGAGRRYSPAKCIGIDRRVRTGDPDPAHMSTSGVERQNLTMRMMMRRFTRLTNGFSKKIENLTAAVSLHFAYYNLCRVHKTLGTSPAVAAGVEDHVWTIHELIALLEGAESVPVKRGPYKKRQPAVSN